MCISALLAFASACVGGAPSRMALTGDIPEPIINPMPLIAGFVVGEQIKQYETTEKRQNGKNMVVNMGDSNLRVFRRILNGMFGEVVEFDTLAQAQAAANTVDVVILPAVDDFSLLTPGDASNTFYAISMRHWVDIYDKNGAKIDRLTINSYGRQRQDAKFSRGQQEADDALDDAFRDLAVNLFIAVPERLATSGVISIAAEPDAATE